MQMYVASAGSNNPVGIYRCTLDTTSGSMEVIGTTDTITNCLYLARHPVRPLLYAVGEGHIYAFAVAPDGTLSFINRASTGGNEPCYISVSGDYALVVNYTGQDAAGSVAVFPVRADGGVAPASQQIYSPHNGSSTGPHPGRQDASHPHMITPSPDGALVLVPDLGTDKVMVYQLDRAAGQLQPHTQPHIDITTGSGPRHLAFHPTKRVLYVLSELSPLVTVVAYDATGQFTVMGTYLTLPPDAAPADTLAADIHVTPSGRFLYASNRGHNSLTAYKISDDGLALGKIEHVSTQGDWPRGFALDPAGKMLIAANQHSDDVYTFHIDADSGGLLPTGNTLTIPAPVCIVFA